ncbi:TetR family transcriptional regulator [Streptomyces sp. MBT65]|uniref:TetR/AcrR family transcriptional regulator n=1 Tax=Streptomyces sp. MBT65 TaxID=1488395 RepID=UPI00190946FF|nr:TetR/AcrR family transcriptional regulator [Streptomyces sp. MBT65]MBK3576348.1 TetR family transcriptional regulator [Streptomyces sp. MBT65]
MVDTVRAKPGLREMTRRAVRAQIAETAMTLFVANGFEQTTVDQIAAAVGMSGRSVFRYFPTKEDMVVGHMDEIGDRLAEALAACPLDEDAWTALRHAMQPHLDELTAHADSNVSVARMLDATPALRPSLLNKRARWAEALLPNIVRRLRGPTRTRELRARAIVSSALACLNVAVDEWARAGGTQPIDDLLDTALTAVRG